MSCSTYMWSFTKGCYELILVTYQAYVKHLKILHHQIPTKENIQPMQNGSEYLTWSRSGVFFLDLSFICQSSTAP